MNLYIKILVLALCLYLSVGQPCSSYYYPDDSTESCKPITRNLIVGGDPVSSGIKSRESQWFNVNLTENTYYRFYMISPQGMWDTYLYLLDNSTTQLAYNDDSYSTPSSTIGSYLAEYTGDYKVRTAGFGSNWGRFITQAWIFNSTSCSAYTTSCTSCPSKSASCTPGNCADTFYCAACSDGLTPYGATCVSTCPPATILSNGVCYSCWKINTRCSSCSSSSVCTACDDGYSPSSDGSTCLCAGNSYLDSDDVCHQCSSSFDNCETCSSSGCDTCSSGYYFFPDGCLTCSAGIPHCANCSLDATCTACSSGYYIDPDTSACTSCSSSISDCATCSDAATCTTCSSGFYINADHSCSTCSSAMPNCATCSDATTCTTCSSGFYINTGHSCSTCSSAMPNCATCSDAATCTTCSSDLYINTGHSCSTCSSTMPNCATCSDTATCTTCSSGFYINADHSCSSCSSAMPDCATCSDATTCTTCSSGFQLNSTGSCTRPTTEQALIHSQSQSHKFPTRNIVGAVVGSVAGFVVLLILTKFLIADRIIKKRNAASKMKKYATKSTPEENTEKPENVVMESP